MSTLPVITNGFYCAYRFTLSAAQSAETTFCVIGATADPATLGETLIGLWTTELAAKFSGPCVLSSVATTKLDGTAGEIVTPSTAAGTDSDPPTPDNCAMITTLRTGLAGRSKRGRMYWPGQVNNKVNSDRFTWTAAHVAAWQSAIDGWHSGLEADDLILSVLSRTLSSAQTVTSITARPVIGTQRRRLTGGLIF